MLRDSGRRGISFGLNRPQRAVLVPGDKINSGVWSPPSRPLVPQPDLRELCAVEVVCAQEPLTHPLPLLAPALGLWIEAVQERREAGAAHEGD